MKTIVKESFKCPTNDCYNYFEEGEEIEVTWQGTHYCEMCGKPIYLLINDDGTVEI